MPKGFRDLNVYQEAYSLAMDIFHESKRFPKEEKYLLVDQVRRSSRAVCAVIAEGYRKRMYPKIFSLMMIDASAEGSETTVQLDFAFDCGYLQMEKYLEYIRKYEEIGKMLSSMSKNPEKFMSQY